jgi:hypothetical protein
MAQEDSTTFIVQLNSSAYNQYIFDTVSLGGGSCEITIKATPSGLSTAIRLSKTGAPYPISASIPDAWPSLPLRPTGTLSLLSSGAGPTVLVHLVGAFQTNPSDNRVVMETLVGAYE